MALPFCGCVSGNGKHQLSVSATELAAPIRVKFGSIKELCWGRTTKAFIECLVWWSRRAFCPSQVKVLFIFSIPEKCIVCKSSCHFCIIRFLYITIYIFDVSILKLSSVGQKKCILLYSGCSIEIFKYLCGLHSVLVLSEHVEQSSAAVMLRELRVR